MFEEKYDNVFVDEPAEDEVDDADYLYIFEIDRLEKKQFESVPGQGKSAHAYKQDIDNCIINKLREDGKTYREIAAHFGCSPSTIRNRYKKLWSK